jgi:hypothetical protein
MRQKFARRRDALVYYYSNTQEDAMTRVQTMTAMVLLAGSAAAAHADERSFPVTGFNRVAVAGAADVDVTTGQAVSVRATGPAAALDQLDIRVSGDRLVIGTKKNSGWHWGSNDHVKVFVTVPMIEGLGVSGSSDVHVSAVKTARFDASVSGSGDLDLPAVDADSVSLSIAGSGDIKAAGRCGALSIEISGSGDVNTSGLHCTTLTASVAGSGDISAFATRTAVAKTAGSGDIRVRGGAACTMSKAGSGSIDCTP